MMVSVLQDADQLQLNYLTLLTNQTEASIWIDRVLDSAMGMVMKVCHVFVPYVVFTVFILCLYCYSHGCNDDPLC